VCCVLCVVCVCVCVCQPGGDASLLDAEMGEDRAKREQIGPARRFDENILLNSEFYDLLVGACPGNTRSVVVVPTGMGISTVA
jgi:hypothetical protein